MTDDTRVLYNHTCPVCRVEIDAYRRRALAQGLPIRFDSLDRAQDWGLDPDAAARRLHVWHEGQILSGLPAFRALWAQMPGMRWAARVTGLPVIRPAVAFLYDRVAAPLLYAAHRRRVSRSG